jgi:iron complex outermembrane receptor protein
MLHASASVATEAADSASLEEIVVTAQKRSEKILDVPISITALSGDQLESAGVTGTQGLVNEVPGLHMDRVGDTSLPSIRGVTTFPTTAGVENNVALYIDNIYEPGTAASTMDLPDISSVAVLKGPQGTLFGRNATGGAIQIFTKDPQLNAVGGNIELGYGNYNDAVVKGFLTGPIVPGVLAASVSAYYESADNYYRNLTPNVPQPGIENYSFRGKLLYEPMDDTRVLITGYVSQHSDPSALEFEPLDGITAAKGVTGAVIPTKPWEVASNSRIPLTVLGDGANIQIHQKTPEGDLTILGSWSDSKVTQDTTISGAAAFPAPYTGTTPYGPAGLVLAKSYQAEVDFASRKFGPFSFVAGANYYNSFNAWDPIGGLTDIPGTDYFATIYGGETTTSYAVFGEGTYQITDDLSLIAGVRYNDDDRSLIGMFYFDELPPAGANNLPTWATRNWGSVTQRASLSYKVTPSTNAYFTYSTVFRAATSTTPPYRSTRLPPNAPPKMRPRLGAAPCPTWCSRKRSPPSNSASNQSLRIGCTWTRPSLTTR